MLSLTSPIETPYHRIPPGPKLLALCVVSVGLFQLRDPLLLTGAASVVALLYLTVGFRFALIGLIRLRPLWPFVAVIALWHLFTGDVPLGVTICLRLLTLVALANLVTMTTRLDAMIETITRFLAPLRCIGLQPGIVGFAIALVFRFIPVLMARVQMLIQAWRARCARMPGWRILLPVFLTVLDDADHVAEALRARGGLPTFDQKDP